MVQTHHHADRRIGFVIDILSGFEGGELVVFREGVGEGVCWVRRLGGWVWRRGGGRGGDLDVRRDGTAKSPEVLYARDGADEVAVGHVGEG